MAERPIWRGHLRLALVSCPVALFTAHTERSTLHFHFINPETGNRIRMITQDAETGDELSRRDLVKGYEFKKDNYLIVTNEDFEAAKIESSSTMNVEKFVPLTAIDPVYFESSYYMVPDGDAGEDVYVVLRDAIAQSERMALSRVVIARRERAVAIMPMDRGLIAHTLRESKGINNPHALFDHIPNIKSDDEMVKLAMQLIARQSGEFDPADTEDRYEARLREVIEAKLRGEGIEPEAEPEEDRGNVIDLMAALKKSLQAGADSARIPNESAPRKPAKTTPMAELKKAKPTTAKARAPAKPAAPAPKTPASHKPARRRA